MFFEGMANEKDDANNEVNNKISMESKTSGSRSLVAEVSAMSKVLDLSANIPLSSNSAIVREQNNEIRAGTLSSGHLITARHGGLSNSSECSTAYGEFVFHKPSKENSSDDSDIAGNLGEVDSSNSMPKVDDDNGVITFPKGQISGLTKSAGFSENMNLLLIQESESGVTRQKIGTRQDEESDKPDTGTSSEKGSSVRPIVPVNIDPSVSKTNDHAAEPCSERDRRKKCCFPIFGRNRDEQPRLHRIRPERERTCLKNAGEILKNAFGKVGVAVFACIGG